MLTYAEIRSLRIAERLFFCIFALSEKFVHLHTHDERINMARVRRAKKVKYLKLYSPFLMRETKHELIGEPMVTETGNRRQWARCTVSRHSQMIDLDALEARQDKSAVIVPISKDDSIPYSPRDEYQVGEIIYHKMWDDIGIITGKDMTSNGAQAIIVQFEKNKEKRLIEKLTI